MSKVIKENETIISAYVPHSRSIAIDCVPLFGKVGEYDRVDIGDLVETNSNAKDGKPVSGIVVKITSKTIYFSDDNGVEYGRAFKNVRLLDWRGNRNEQTS